MAGMPNQKILRIFWFSEFAGPCPANSTNQAGREAGCFQLLELLREAQQLRKANIRRDADVRPRKG
jgi:hypothetical protein